MNWFSELDLEFVESTEALFVQAESKRLNEATTELHGHINNIRERVDELGAHNTIQLHSWPLEGRWMRVLLSPTYERGGKWELSEDERTRYLKVTTNHEYTDEAGQVACQNKEYFVDFKTSGVRVYSGMAYVQDGSWHPKEICPPLIKSNTQDGPHTYRFAGYSPNLPRPLDNASLEEITEQIQIAQDLSDIVAYLGSVSFDASREYEA